MYRIIFTRHFCSRSYKMYVILLLPIIQRLTVFFYQTDVCTLAIIHSSIKSLKIHILEKQIMTSSATRPTPRKVGMKLYCLIQYSRQHFYTCSRKYTIQQKISYAWSRLQTVLYRETVTVGATDQRLEKCLMAMYAQN